LTRCGSCSVTTEPTTSKVFLECSCADTTAPTPNCRKSRIDLSISPVDVDSNGTLVYSPAQK
jgi:hypothetical protein